MALLKRAPYRAKSKAAGRSTPFPAAAPAVRKRAPARPRAPKLK